MQISDLLQETYSALLINKVRSGLTALGIIIGIGSVIAMIAIGQGAQSSIQSNIEALGSNLIMVMPSFTRGVGTQVNAGRGSAQTLTLDDADAIQQNISLAQAVAQVQESRQQVTAKGTNTNTQIIGTNDEYPSVRNIKISDGTFFSSGDVSNTSKVAILGPTTASDLFGTDTEPVGQTIRIKGINFTVIGVTESEGASAMGNADDIILIPISTSQRFLSGNSFVNTIYVQAVSQNSMTALQNQITSLLLQRHNISDPTKADFSTLNQADLVNTASSVVDTFTLLLGAVAGISLVVGGIGIMNMMLTTVTERTREIGLRKAIGAKRMDINLQFLAEAVMLTFVGGVAGIVLGWVVAMGISHFGGITTKISFTSIALAFGISALIGILFGYYPAQRASKLNPIEALRYE